MARLRSLSELKVATARVLIVIAGSAVPLSMNEVQSEVAKRYDKEYDGATLKQAFEDLFKRQWVTRELCILKDGKTALDILNTHKDGLAAKFFRKSDSPNFGDRAPKQPAAALKPAHKAHAGLVTSAQ